MKAILKPKHLDGPEDQQWSMFKSISREEPHHSLYAIQLEIPNEAHHNKKANWKALHKPLFQK
ncbi:9633_t:CDS:2, partial [Funneliformis geosporum]